MFRNSGYLKIIRWALTFILLLLPIFLLSSAEIKAKAIAINTKCLSCHGSESPSEERIKIDDKAFYVSAHRALKCTDCHQVLLEEKGKETSHRKDIPEVNCTSACHRESEQAKPGESPLYYPDSVHGRAYLERGVKEVARCWDCHGKHSIRKKSDPESWVSRKNIPLTCSACHADMNVVIKYNIHRETPYQEYMQSVHGKSLKKKGMLSYAAVCTDCHGIHDIKGVGDLHLSAKKPETCGKCHPLVFDEYRESIHGREALQGNIDVPLCVDCHGEHKIVSHLDETASTSPRKIPDTCSTCHARPEIMKKYGIPDDRIKTFIESMHGIAIGYGYAAAANCSSCHGVHDIRPATDPGSKVNPANLARTCGQEKCHPGMPEKIASSKIHITTSQKKGGALYYLQQTLLWIVFVAVLFTVIWFFPGFIKKIRAFRKK
jgi:hypothetical protein